MRVRPFFWLVLAASCISVLVFAAKWQVHVPAVMQVHIEQQATTASDYTTIHLHLADEQGVPIEAAQVFSRASMTNMNMVSKQSSIRYVGQGNYVAQLHLYMAGPWLITIEAQADGFDMPHQTLYVQVL
jgi:nitrogen fixation protein FixH